MPAHPCISLVVATKLEGDPLLDLLSLKKETAKPFPLYRRKDVNLIISGMGKANAAMATTYAILTHQSSMVSNLGAAGAVSPGYMLGDIYHIGKVIDYDRPHLLSEMPRIRLPLVLRGFPTAVIATQDKPVIESTARAAIAACTDLVDMEAAAVVQVCAKFRVPCAVFKFVSDTPDHECHHDIVAQIKRYCSPFAEFFAGSVLPLLREHAQSMTAEDTCCE